MKKFAIKYIAIFVFICYNRFNKYLDGDYMRALKRCVCYMLVLCLSLSMCSCAAQIEETPPEVTIATTEATDVTTTEAPETEITTTVSEVTEEVTDPVSEEPEEPVINSVSMIYAGDNLIHSSIYNQAKRRAKANGDEDGYDFDFVYEQVEHYIKDADFAILNQETIVTDELEPSDYPRFCSPADLGEKMIELGFDAFSMSNNHILDRGEQGLIATLDFWDSHPEVIRYGAYRNEEDMNNLRTVEINGITFAFLGYTEHTNGLSLKSDSECIVTYLSEVELIEQQVRYADSVADVVIVSPHFGKETTNKLTEKQINMANLLVEWGADIIIGTQPHTAQTIELVEKEDGSQALIYYCLGNFVSAQSYYLTMVGILGGVTVNKNMTSGEIYFSDIKAIPLITQYGYNYSNIHIVPYVNYTDELLAEHGCDGFDQGVIDHVLSFIPEEYLSIE